MGAYNQSPHRRRYANINKGKFCEWVTDHNEEYTHISGRLVNITFKHDEKFGEKMQLHLIDEQDYWIVEMFLNSRYALYFLMLMQNIDPLHDVVLSASYTETEGKKESALYVNQRGQSVQWFYSKKKGMKDLPPLAACKIKNPTGTGLIDSWDNTDRMLFLLNIVTEIMVPKLQRIPNPYPNHPVYMSNTGKNEIAGKYFGSEERYRVPGPVSSVEAGDNTNPADDLPF